MFVFLTLFVTIILLSFMLSYKYTHFSQVEAYFYKNRKLLILLIPAIFLLLAIAWWLATGETGFDYWKLKNISMQAFNELSKKFSEQLIDNVALISAIVINGLILIWILVTEQFKHSVGKTAVDIGAILIVSFFNPYASSFLISFLKNDIFLTNGVLLTAVFVSIINLIIYQINCPPLKIEKSGKLKSLFYNKYHVVLK